MLRISQSLFQRFEDTARSRFEDEMVAHSMTFSPKLCRILGEDQVRDFVRLGIQRATAHGFGKRGPLRLYLEMMFLYGSDFDTDVQYPTFYRVLRNGGDEMIRAEMLHDETVRYQDEVGGENAVNVWHALAALKVLSATPPRFTEGAFEQELLGELERIFPLKVRYSGRLGLLALMRKGRKLAQAHHLPNPEGDALVVALMFAFGHGCTKDPLYPWIARTLDNENIVDGDRRSFRLQRRATIWLDRVLENAKGTAHR
jgi:hypothetical protein